MKRGRFFTPWILAFVMALAFVLSGCGKKADPRVPGAKPAPPLLGLKLEKAPASLIVRWPVREDERGATVFRIERSALDPKGEDCPGCPRTFETLAEVAADDAACREAGSGQCRYVDDRVKAGYNYIYRLQSCDRAGRCTRVSAPAEIVF